MTRRQIAALLVAVAVVAGLATTAANVAWFVYAPPLAAALPPTGTAQPSATPRSTAVPTASPTMLINTPESPPVLPTLARNPTAVSIYLTQQAGQYVTMTTRQLAGCAAIEQVYRAHGRDYDRFQDPELTVVEVFIMQGANPQINSTLNNQAKDKIRQNALACQGR